MPSIQKNNRAAALLAMLRDDDRLSLDRLALLAGVSLQTLRDCLALREQLEPAAQVRVARAIGSRVPRLAAHARRLEEQAAAATTMQDGATKLHLTAPAKWWGR